MKDSINQKDGFVIYKSFYDPISHLTDEQLGRLFRSLFQWQINGKAKPGPDIIMAFGFFVNQFRIDNEKYQDRCDKNRENAQKRWQMQSHANASKSIRTGANDADKDKDNDNGNVKGRGGNGALTLPFPDNPEFISTWNELREQPRWKRKTVTALQKSLDKLSRYDVRFAVELMETAISGNYQGVTFPDTPSRYEQWLKTHPQPQNNQDEGNGDIYSIYDD